MSMSPRISRPCEEDFGFHFIEGGVREGPEQRRAMPDLGPHRILLAACGGCLRMMAKAGGP